MKKLPTAVKEAMATAKKREGRPENKIQVTAVTDDLNPEVARTRRQLEKAKLSEKGLVKSSGPNLFDIEVAPESAARVITFLNALVSTAEDCGCKIVNGEHAPVFSVDGETLELEIVEQTTRSEHEPTGAEHAAIERWEKRQQRGRRNWDHGGWTPPPTPPEWDYTPNGRL